MLNLLDAYYYINLISIYSLLVCLFLLWMNKNKIRNFSDIAFCVICVISSIVWDDVENVIWERVFLLGALLAPFSIWLFAKAIFKPSTITLKWKALYVGLSLFIYLTIYSPPNPTFALIMDTGATLLYLFFAAMVIKEIYQYNNKSEKRYRSKIIMIFQRYQYLASHCCCREIINSGRKYLLYHFQFHS